MNPPRSNVNSGNGRISPKPFPYGGGLLWGVEQKRSVGRPQSRAWECRLLRAPANCTTLPTLEETTMAARKRKTNPAPADLTAPARKGPTVRWSAWRFRRRRRGPAYLLRRHARRQRPGLCRSVAQRPQSRQPVARVARPPHGHAGRGGTGPYGPEAQSRPCRAARQDTRGCRRTSCVWKLRPRADRASPSIPSSAPWPRVARRGPSASSCPALAARERWDSRRSTPGAA